LDLFTKLTIAVDQPQMPEMSSILFSLLPMAQEFYLFCFFCMGFALFRCEVFQRLLCIGGNAMLKQHDRVIREEPSTWFLLEDVNDDEADYKQVLASWPHLHNHTAEALFLAITALLALGRLDEVGAFVSRAVGEFPHLRQSLHQVIESLSRPTREVDPKRAVVALRQILKQAHNVLPGSAAAALAVAFAQQNDEPRVVDAMAVAAASCCDSEERTIVTEALAGVVGGFVECRNFDAALGHLQQLLQTSSGYPMSDLAARVVRLSTETAPVGDRQRVWDALDFLEVTVASGAAPIEAFSPLFEWAAAQNPPQAALAMRAEKCFRTATTNSGIPVSASCCVELVRVQAKFQDNHALATACFDEVAESAFACLVEQRSEELETHLVGIVSAAAECLNVDLVKSVLHWALRHKCSSAKLLSSAVEVLIAARQPELCCALYEAFKCEEVEVDEGTKNQLITMATQAGQLALARDLLRQISNWNVEHYINLIRACGQEGGVLLALDVFQEFKERGEVDTSAHNCMLDVCVSCGENETARRLFEEMQASGHVDVISFNILLKQYTTGANCLSDAHRLLQEMRSCGLRPNAATFNSLLSASLSAGNFEQGWHMVEMMEEGGQAVDAYTVSILFRGQKRERQPMDSRSFDRALSLMRRQSLRVDEVLVVASLEACLALRCPARLDATLEILQRSGWAMPKQCAMHTYGILIKAFGQKRQMGIVWQLWEEATREKAGSEQIYGQMIDVLVASGSLEDALALFEEMKRAYSERLDSQGFSVAYAMIIRGFAQRKECEQALRCYEEMKGHGTKVGHVVFNTLIDACSRVGDMDAGARVYRDMTNADCSPDLITYSTLIKGYCVNGDLEQAMELFSLMRNRGFKPDSIVFNSLLDGCARRLKPELCDEVLMEMEQAGVPASNYSASILIKLYGRCKNLAAAFKVIDEMPEKHGFKPNTAVYTCMMTTCAANGRLDLAVGLLDKMSEAGVQPDDRTYSTLLKSALKAGSAERSNAVIRTALKQGGTSLLEKALVQSALNLMHRRRVWDSYGHDLFDLLHEVGMQMQYPTGDAGTGSLDTSTGRSRVVRSSAAAGVPGRQRKQPVKIGAEH